MARYIDADKVMEEIARIGGHNFCKWHTIGVKALIDRQTTADVAPRSEVAREIFGEIEEIRGEFLQGNLTGADVIVKLFLLKQKYTEDQK